MWMVSDTQKLMNMKGGDMFAIIKVNSAVHLLEPVRIACLWVSTAFINHFCLVNKLNSIFNS